MTNLSHLKSSELAQIYRSSATGQIPNGNSAGKAIILPGTFAGTILSGVANLLWKGKVVDSSSKSLVNKILGMKIIRADVFVGPSWSDDKQAIIVDYLHTSLLAFFIRDEVREVEPGLYLGKAFIRLPLGLRFSALYFSLDFNG